MSGTLTFVIIPAQVLYFSAMMVAMSLTKIMSTIVLKTTLLNIIAMRIVKMSLIIKKVIQGLSFFAQKLFKVEPSK